jgi:2-C-methyl-D-erythritol 4-phosphate cytidylyltransferase
MRTVAVVLAGGSGSRFGGSLPKQLRLLAGRTLVEHCVAAFNAAPGVDEILVVIGAEYVARAATELGRYDKLVDVVAGGSARTDSTQQAITAITAAAAELATSSDSDTASTGRDGRGNRGKQATIASAADCNILFHDAARPLISQEIIADCVAALDRWPAIGVVVPSADTIVEVADGALGRVLPRSSLARCQTPQGFRLSVIDRAYRAAAADAGFAAMSATDDCGVVRRYLPDVQIGAVPGSERNMKITYPGDLAIAEALLRQSAGSDHTGNDADPGAE